MRLIFAGTPETAVPSLDALLGSRHEVAAVITRPDAAAGRGRRVGPSPVGRRASEAGLPVLQPASVRAPGFLDRLRALSADCCTITAYGALIPQAAVDIPRHGWVNVHFSLLPAWRGAAPVPHAIMHGDDIAGATTFQLVAELDAGPVYGAVTEPIRPSDTAGDLLARLSQAGAELLVRTLDGIESGQLQPRPQPAEGVSYAPKLTAEDARVRWVSPALAVGRHIRACTPAPGAWTMLGDRRLKLWPLAATPGTLASPSGSPSPAPAASATGGSATGLDLRPGQLLVTRAGVFAGTATWPVQLGDVQQSGKRKMPAAEWSRGLHLGTDGSSAGDGASPASGAGRVDLVLH
jgi:methionyl-tRNA formyltransferase